MIGDNFEHSAVEKADDYITELDKMDFMYAESLSSIIDWEILQVGDDAKSVSDIVLKTPNELSIQKDEDNHKMFKEYLKLIKPTLNPNTSERFIADMVACYGKQYDNIKDMDIIKQIEITMSTVSSAYDSAINVYDRLSEYDKKLKAVPKSVWKEAFNQNKLSASEYVKQYMDNPKN